MPVRSARFGPELDQRAAAMGGSQRRALAVRPQLDVARAGLAQPVDRDLGEPPPENSSMTRWIASASRDASRPLECRAYTASGCSPKRIEQEVDEMDAALEERPVRHVAPPATGSFHGARSMSCQTCLKTSRPTSGLPICSLTALKTGFSRYSWLTATLLPAAAAAASTRSASSTVETNGFSQITCAPASSACSAELGVRVGRRAHDHELRPRQVHELLNGCERRRVGALGPPGAPLLGRVCAADELDAVHGLQRGEVELPGRPTEADYRSAHGESLVVGAQDASLEPADVARITGEERLALHDQPGVSGSMAGKRDHDQRAVAGDIVRRVDEAWLKARGPVLGDVAAHASSQPLRAFPSTRETNTSACANAGRPPTWSVCRCERTTQRTVCGASCEATSSFGSSRSAPARRTDASAGGSRRVPPAPSGPCRRGRCRRDAPPRTRAPGASRRSTRPAGSGSRPARRLPRTRPVVARRISTSAATDEADRHGDGPGDMVQRVETDAGDRRRGPRRRRSSS